MTETFCSDILRYQLCCLSQVPTLYAVLSTVSAQLNTQNECSDKKRKFINFATQNRAKAKRKCFFQWQDHSENERKFRFAESEDFSHLYCTDVWALLHIQMYARMLATQMESEPGITYSTR